CAAAEPVTDREDHPGEQTEERGGLEAVVVAVHRHSFGTRATKPATGTRCSLPHNYPEIAGNSLKIVPRRLPTGGGEHELWGESHDQRHQGRTAERRRDRPGHARARRGGGRASGWRRGGPRVR